MGHMKTLGTTCPRLTLLGSDGSTSPSWRLAGVGTSLTAADRPQAMARRSRPVRFNEIPPTAQAIGYAAGDSRFRDGQAARCPPDLRPAQLFFLVIALNELIVWRTFREEHFGQATMAVSCFKIPIVIVKTFPQASHL